MMLGGVTATSEADALFEVVSENKQPGAALTDETNCTHQKHAGGPADIQPVRLCTVALASYPSKNIFTLASVQSQQNIVGFFFVFHFGGLPGDFKVVVFHKITNCKYFYKE